MKQRNNLVLGLILLGLCLAPSLWAQTAYRLGSPRPRQTGPLEASGGEAYQSWVNAKWTGDERPYLKVKAALDAALARGTKAPTLVAQYEGPARANELDPKAQYAWAYATQLEVETRQGIPQNPALYGLRRLGAPDCYPVARLRFLLTQELEPNDDHLYLRPVAERLMKHDPSDIQVRRTWIFALCSRPVGMGQALRLAQEDVARIPTGPGAHVTLAGVYDLMFINSHARDTAYQRRAIQEYEAFLKYAKPDDDYRPQAVRRIQGLKTEKPW